MTANSGALLSGHDTARVSAGGDATAVRDAIADQATRYLIRTGNADLLPILGLTTAPPRSKAVATTARALPERRCPVCGNRFRSPHRNQKTCSRTCGHRTRWEVQPS